MRKLFGDACSITKTNEFFLKTRFRTDLLSFTGLRLLDIGRNQYIELMNQCRSTKKLFRGRKTIQELLPQHPADISVESWWIAQIGHVMEWDVKSCTAQEKAVIDKLIDDGPAWCGTLDATIIRGEF